MPKHDGDFRSVRHLFRPVRQMKVFLDLASFVTVFEGFFRATFSFPKRMLRIANGLADDFQCFCHSNLSVRQTVRIRPSQRAFLVTLTDRLRPQAPRTVLVYDKTKTVSFKKFSRNFFGVKIMPSRGIRGQPEAAPAKPDCTRRRFSQTKMKYRCDADKASLLCPCGSKNHFFNNAYSIESTSACKLASMMFSLTPTVPHSRLPSLDVMSTRVLAAVPVVPLMIRTL